MSALAIEPRQPILKSMHLSPTLYEPAITVVFREGMGHVYALYSVAVKYS